MFDVIFVRLMQSLPMVLWKYQLPVWDQLRPRLLLFYYY